MNSKQRFSLKQFLPIPRLDLTITGQLAQQGDTLAIRYELRGPLAKLAIPAPAAAPSRRHGLWQETCFEFFLAARDCPDYWEFNLSPAGHWNVYYFTDYRQGLQEEPAFPSLPIHVRSSRDSLLLDLTVDLGQVIATHQPLEMAISAVIKPKEGAVTYWALTHPGPQPDFHRRDSFTIAL